MFGRSARARMSLSMSSRLMGLGLLLIVGSGCVSGRAQEVAVILTGEFSSREQAEMDPEYFPIQLRHVPIWVDRADGPWLYVEQALEGKAPYRQRIYHLVNVEGGVRSEIFTMPSAPEYAGANAERLSALTPDDLTPREGCAIELERIAKGHYRGSTVDDECTSTLAGATYATSEVDLRHRELVTWDRGYDADGNQVWGATAGPYRFRRIEAGAPSTESSPPDSTP